MRNEKIILREGNEIISTDSELNRIFSTFSSKVVQKLKILSISNYTHNESNDSLKETRNYLENQPSIVNIKRKGYNTSFTFRETNFNEFIKFIKTLNISKACHETDISTPLQSYI